MICKDKKQKEILLSFRTVYNKKVAFGKPKATPITIAKTKCDNVKNEM
mgnify:CR=1 FL=1